MKKIIIFILTVVLLFGCFNATAFAEESEDKSVAQYPISLSVEDDPSTPDHDEAFLAQGLYNLFGEYLNVYFSIEKTETCKERYNIRVGSGENVQFYLVYLSTIPTPKDAMEVLSTRGFIYYYYTEPTRIYTCPYEILINDVKTTIYLNEEFEAGFFYDIYIGELEQPENTEPSIPDPIMDGMYDYIDSLAVKIKNTYLCLILVSVIAAGSIVLTLITRKQLRDLMNEKDKASNQDEFSKKKNHK